MKVQSVYFCIHYNYEVTVVFLMFFYPFPQLTCRSSLNKEQVNFTQNSKNAKNKKSKLTTQGLTGVSVLAKIKVRKIIPGLPTLR